MNGLVKTGMLQRLESIAHDRDFHGLPANRLI